MVNEAQFEPADMSPHSQDAEEAVLGSVLINPDAYGDAATVLKTGKDEFFILRNAWIWDAMTRLFDRGDVVDLLTVTEELRGMGKLNDAGGGAYLAYLASQIATSVHAEAYAQIVARAAFRRRLLKAASEIAELARDEDANALDIEAQAQTLIESIPTVQVQRDMQPLSNAVSDDYDRIQAILNGELAISIGVPTGLSDLDKMLGGGCQQSDFLVIAGRPGWGKTTVMLNMAHYMASKDYNVAFFSLEMKPDQLQRRIAAAITGLSTERIRRGDLTDQEMRTYVAKFTELSDITSRIMTAYPSGTAKQRQRQKVNVGYLRSHCLKLRDAGLLDVVFLDYLQLMQTGISKTDRGRQLELEAMTRELKDLAGELDVPLIAGAQMNRAIEGRGTSAAPKLSDLRETGAIENDADVVMFIYPKDEATKDSSRVIGIEKQRNGPTGTMIVDWQPAQTLLRNHATEQGKSEMWYHKGDK